MKFAYFLFLFLIHQCSVEAETTVSVVRGQATQFTLKITIFIQKNKQYIIYIKYYLHYIEASSFHIVVNNLQALCFRKNINYSNRPNVPCV